MQQLPPLTLDSPSHSPSPSLSEVNQIEFMYHQTEPNDFGLYQCYKEQPSVEPDMGLTIDELSDAPTFTSHASRTASNQTSSANPFFPFINATIFWLFAWFYELTSKSLSDLTSLVRNVIRAPDFDCDHLPDSFDAAKEIKVLDTIDSQPNLPFSLSGDWHETLVTIRLPQTGVKHVSEEEAPKFEVTGIYHCNILDIIVSAFQDTSFLDYHLKGFQEMWDPGDGHPVERVYGEVYTSEKYLEMEDELHPEPDPDSLETVIVPCMYYSDSTHLSSFGTAALWPIYLLFGLLSKYVRAQPTSGAAHHLVYMPSLPDCIQDAYKQHFNKPASLGILTFLK
ncbi:uncharacterized protein ARMOST_21629 [Armillaria ostoyae]|uniref:Uncharacterized protein n=1 Tax=Armillaria ostoyae TaxID=47428 RepID=A0A284SAK6_ARMOS|nr:uncharacterized protein ARMOST_21629 [Armillaria ostoyae]